MICTDPCQFGLGWMCGRLSRRSCAHNATVVGWGSSKQFIKFCKKRTFQFSYRKYFIAGCLEYANKCEGFRELVDSKATYFHRYPLFSAWHIIPSPGLCRVPQGIWLSEASEPYSRLYFPSLGLTKTGGIKLVSASFWRKKRHVWRIRN